MYLGGRSFEQEASGGAIFRKRITRLLQRTRKLHFPAAEQQLR